MTKPDELEEVRQRVRTRYAQAANAVTGGGIATCAETCRGQEETGTGSQLYDAAEQSEVPEDAVSASLGCGNPIAVAGLQPGETILDLGSGGGIDVLLSARRVGPAGKIQIHRARAVCALARKHAAACGWLIRAHGRRCPPGPGALRRASKPGGEALQAERARSMSLPLRTRAPGQRAGKALRPAAAIPR